MAVTLWTEVSATSSVRGAAIEIPARAARAKVRVERIYMLCCLWKCCWFRNSGLRKLWKERRRKEG